MTGADVESAHAVKPFETGRRAFFAGKRRGKGRGGVDDALRFVRLEKWGISMWGMLFRAIQFALRTFGRVGVGVGVRVANHGRIAFIGLIGRRPLAQLGQQEIRNAFAKIGLREAHNGHFVSRLIERGPQFGVHTLDDFARAMNYGTARVGAQPGTIEIVFPSGRAAAVANAAGELVTLLPL